MSFPARIICLTEETVETLYLLGRQDLIQGVSKYVERPPEAKGHPVVSQFLRSDIELITSLKPDLVIGFSDIQKDIARELIGNGLNVMITNQRSLQEILDSILLLSRMIGEEKKGQLLVDGFRRSLDEAASASRKLPFRPRVYFEEWDQPRLSAIRWVSELIEVCGGENIFSAKTGSLAREREVTDQEIIEGNPQIIFGCWCGKKVDIGRIQKRANYEGIEAVQNKFIWELPPAIFLQPGPALFIDGLKSLSMFFTQVTSHP